MIPVLLVLLSLLSAALLLVLARVEDRVVRLTIQFGNTAARLSRTVKTGQPSQSAYYQPANGGSAGSTRFGSISGYDGVGYGNFTPP